MVEQVAQLLGLIGFNLAPPETMTELIPYLLHAGIAIGILLAIFKLFRFMVSLVFGRPRM